MPWITLAETLEIATPPSTDVAPNRWAFQIEGEADDIGDLARALNGANGAGGLRVGYLAQVPALTSPQWDVIDKADEAQALAEAALNDCVGCLNLLNVCGFLKIGTVYEIKEAGRSVMTRYSHVKLNIKKALDERAPPEVFQMIFRIARDNEWFASCLPIYYEEPTFYTVYKAVEAIRRHCGGESKMKARSDFDGSKLAKIKTVADYHRHAQPPSRAKPNPFYSLDECIVEVTIAIDKLLNSETRRGTA